LDIPQRIINALAADEQRNLLILARTEEMVRRHSRIIVFAATKDHAVVLATVLRARGHWAYAVTGETPASDRSRIIATYRAASDDPRVIVNFGVLTTGFDAPQTSAAVIARPTKSLVLFSQMVGRSTRGPKAGGNKNAEVATVVDTRLPGFCNMADAFNNWEDVW
jgi:superfamily II DNA or RNA helicase